MKYKAIKVRWVTYFCTIHEGKTHNTVCVDLKNKGQTVLFDDIQNILFICLNNNIDNKYWFCMNCDNFEHKITRVDNRCRVETKINCEEIVKSNDKLTESRIIRELI